jgi:hypothetical protein
MNKCRLICFYRRVLFLFLVVSLTGCLEASFELAPESRLPKWLDAPTGVSRSDLKVTMDYYSTFNGGEYVFKFYDKNKILKIQKIILSTEEQPTIRTRELKIPPVGFPKGYPAYNVVTVNGITDIVERRKMEPIFYMTDDPVIWRELGIEQK